MRSPRSSRQTQQFAPSPVYVTAPTPPKTLGNRAAGILIGLIATAVFAAVYALIAFFISAGGAATVADATARFTDFLVLPVFYLPVIFFFLAFALLVSVSTAPAGGPTCSAASSWPWSSTSPTSAAPCSPCRRGP